MTNLVQKKITIDEVSFDTISHNNNIYLEFDKLCSLLNLSDSYYYKKLSNDKDLENAFVKNFVKGKRGFKNKIFIDVTCLDLFINKISNSHHNENYYQLKENLKTITNNTIAMYNPSEVNPVFEIYIKPKTIRNICFKDKNFICIERENDGEKYIALKHMFNQFNLDLADYLFIFKENSFSVKYLSKTSIDNINVLLFNIRGLAWLFETLRKENTIKEAYELTDYINDFFKEKETIKIPKNYMETLSLLLNSEENNSNLEQENIKLQLEIEELRKKAIAYDQTISAINLQDMKQISSVFGIGRNKLFTILREKKVLIEGGEDHNLPYQKYIDQGYFIVRRVIINRTAGKELKNQTLVTPKGMGFINRLFYRNFLKEYSA